MNQSPFAQLGYMHKRASDLFSTGNAAGDLALDVAAGTNPFTGVPYYGAKAVDDFKNGKVWSGLGNTLWGGLSFVGGAALAKGALGGGKLALQTGAKGLMPRAMQAGSNMMARGAHAGGQAIAKGTQAVNAAAQGTGVMARGARGVQQYGNAIQKGQNFAGRQMDTLGNKLMGKNMVSMNGWKPTVQPMNQAAGKRVATTGTLMAGGAVAPANATAATAAAPAAAAVAPTMAPSWYSSVTGNTAMPQF